MQAQIEAASRLSVTGWIGNAHLMEATSADTIREGYRFASEVNRASGLPLAFVTAPRALIDDLANETFACPVLPIRRQLTFPWQVAPSHSKMTPGPSNGAAG
jgi:hypothetical protein